MTTSLPYWGADSHNARGSWRIMAPGSDSLPVEWVHGMAVHLATPNFLFSPFSRLPFTLSSLPKQPHLCSHRIRLWHVASRTRNSLCTFGEHWPIIVALMMVTRRPGVRWRKERGKSKLNCFEQMRGTPKKVLSPCLELSFVIIYHYLWKPSNASFCDDQLIGLSTESLAAIVLLSNSTHQRQ